MKQILKGGRVIDPANNIDKIADAQLKLPHMLPTPTFFKQCVEDLGLNDNEEIVV